METMTHEEFLRDVCPNHTETSKWNKSELLHILELHKEQLQLGVVISNKSKGKSPKKVVDPEWFSKWCDAIKRI